MDVWAHFIGFLHFISLTRWCLDTLFSYFFFFLVDFVIYIFRIWKLFIRRQIKTKARGGGKKQIYNIFGYLPCVCVTFRSIDYLVSISFPIINCPSRLHSHIFMLCIFSISFQYIQTLYTQAHQSHLSFLNNKYGTKKKREKNHNNNVMVANGFSYLGK